MFEECPFFRIGDSVTVKSMSEILETANSKRVILIMECAVIKNREE